MIKDIIFWEFIYLFLQFWNVIFRFSNNRQQVWSKLSGCSLLPRFQPFLFCSIRQHPACSRQLSLLFALWKKVNDRIWNYSYEMVSWDFSPVKSKRTVARPSVSAIDISSHSVRSSSAALMMVQKKSHYLLLFWSYKEPIPEAFRSPSCAYQFGRER